MRATHLIIKTTGTYGGHPYTYEETVPIDEYRMPGWALWFKPRKAREILRQLADAKAGDRFVIEDPASQTCTEIRAIALPGA